jgi:hypothetical protein
MSPGKLGPKSSKFRAQRSLLIVSVSTLSRPPGYLVNCPVNHRESNRAGYSPSHSVRNSASHLDGYPGSYWAGYFPENPAGSREGCPDSNPAGYSAGCPDNRPESNVGDNLPDCLESDSAGYLPDWLADCLPMPVPRLLPGSLPATSATASLSALPTIRPARSRHAESRPVACG